MRKQNDIIRSLGPDFVDALLENLCQVDLFKVISLPPLFVIERKTLREYGLRSGHPYPADAFASGLADEAGGEDTFRAFLPRRVKLHQIGAYHRTTHAIAFPQPAVPVGLPAKFPQTRHPEIELVIAGNHHVVADPADDLDGIFALGKRAHSPSLQKITGGGREHKGGVGRRYRIPEAGKGSIPFQRAVNVVFV